MFTTNNQYVLNYFEHVIYTSNLDVYKIYQNIKQKFQLTNDDNLITPYYSCDILDKDIMVDYENHTQNIILGDSFGVSNRLYLFKKNLAWNY